MLTRLWRPKRPDRTRLVLARELVELIATRYPTRPVHLAGDAAYASKTCAA